MKILHVDARLPTPEDETLPWVDFSTLKEIQLCPTKGVVKYIAHKWPTAEHRDMPLEAGNAFHLMCAAWNLYKLGDKEKISELFGSPYAFPLCAMLDSVEASVAGGGDPAILFALSALHDASGFYDNPDDKKRTTKAIEDAFMLHWVPNQLENVTGTLVAVEKPIEYVLTIEYLDNTAAVCTCKVKYRGRVDKVMRGATGLLPVDYKTTTLGLDSEYSAQFELPHQLTGYSIGLRLLFPDEEISPFGMIEAVKLPPAKREGASSYFRGTFDINICEFAQFVIDNYQHIETYLQSSNIEDVERRAPTACNAYFARCPLLSTLCVNSEDDRNMLLEDFDDYSWNPHETR